MVEKTTAYCLRTLPAPAPCYNCRQTVEPGLAGYYYTHPLCPSCFADCEGVLAAILASASTHVPSLAPSPETSERCRICRRPIRSWLAGHSLDGLCCWHCFHELEPALAAVLVLEEGARSLVRDKARASQYVDLVRRYAEALSSLEDG